MTKPVVSTTFLTRRVCNSQVPVPHNIHCPGSSHGWLLTVSPNFKVSLLNPFYHNNNEILLPPLQAFKHDESFREHFYVGFMHKVVLSTNPASEPNNYVVLAVYQARNHLAFFKPGYKTWTCIDSSQVCGFVDIIYYRDQFYYVNFQGDVFSIDFNHPEPEPRVSRIAPSPSLRGGDRRYLVESSGDLLQIVRKIEFEERDGYPDFHFNDGFSAYKWDSGQLMWIELHNLDGRTFFVGDNSSLSVLASDFPECKPNSIYFTDDYFSAYFELEEYGIGPHDMGVFSFEDRTITSHYPTNCKMIYPAPIWIEPPL